MKRLSIISYKAGTKMVSDQVWVQRASASDEELLLKVFTDKDTGKPVLTEDQNGTKQYQVSEYAENGRYAYIAVNTMKALIALGRVRDIDGAKWVHLTCKPLTPAMEQFASATKVTKL